VSKKPGRKAPGRSLRTPLKHELLDRLAQEEVFAAPKLSALRYKDQSYAPERTWLIDLCAGDASVDTSDPSVLRKGGDWWHNCSPGILIRNGRVGALPARVDLYEINRATFDRLIINLTDKLGGPWGRNSDTGAICWFVPKGSDKRHVTVRATLGSGSDATVERIARTDTVFIANDPNHIHDWAMRPTMLAEVLRRTFWCRTFSTLGCNVGGLMMLSMEERVQWYDHLRALEDALPAYHDLCLADIVGDSSKWAYAITTSEKWRERTATTIRKAFASSDMNVEWFRQSPDDFKQQEHRLFLTKNERGVL
jgi:hypothetical protein